MEENNRYYCIFGIGPVQSFIAASRKLEDLWGGSYLLSFLIRQSLTSIRELCRQRQIQYQVIYPNISDNETNQTEGKSLAVANYPNRITFALETSEEKAHGLMSDLELHVRGELVRISDWSIEKVFQDNTHEGKQRIHQLKQQAEEQVQHFLEVNWIAYPCSIASPSNRQEAERMYHSLKGQRSMQVVAEKGIACTVYQRMDALCYQPPFSGDRYGDLKRKLRDTWNRRRHEFKPGDANDPDNARIRDNEFLCGISLVRRVARDFFQEEFNCGSDVFSRYESVVGIGSKQDGYYAVLLMDGDNMGQFFNGSETEVQHTSERLGHFASVTVPSIVKKHEGILLYAGGDDVLALFPVQQVLAAAYQLRKDFGDPVTGLNGATASAAIAVGHKRTPLQQMLNEARTLEKAAKSYTITSGTSALKNAFALSVLPRSGEYLGTIVLPWEKHGVLMTEVLEQLIELLGEVISTSFIYNFAATFQRLIGADTHEEPAYLEEMVLLECYRLMDRSVYDQERRMEYRHQLAQVPELFRQLKLKGFIDLLKMLAFFNRKETSRATTETDAS
ncbi:type III-B CRISPR-associated protein Cas10/Cmr2 [Paenibacillus amylolyticus]|uniref:type III-B CRISPR-associated protein Cas10/Cmr2 n=1 Tax=Paenibacillus amylolyticus TaxID=1451 RepID=UPI00201D49BE|nr:type III-B CRISPR-associated protein Cas10/Cmr2 [Paenibacillus amylolyticus]MCL6663376.1 type III-B CRISPR-associated protein Cas10/Cmr2 [Paenibacillus amylolyticus]